MYTYLYQFANIVIQILVPFQVTQQEPFHKFLLTEQEKEQINCFGEKVIQIQFVSVPSPIVHEKQPIFYNGTRVFQEKDSFYLELSQGKEESITSLQQYRNYRQKKYICKYYEKTKWEFYYSKLLIEAISLEHILNREHIFILHAAYIIWKGKSILFTAPSGTGKSTQAELWNKVEHAQIINGDRAAIGRECNQFFSYGIPFCGSSGISENKNCLLGTIVVLKQSRINKIVRLSETDAFKAIYSEVTMHTWDLEYVQICMEEIGTLVKQVPVYLLECRPEKEAVALLREELLGWEGK